MKIIFGLIIIVSLLLPAAASAKNVQRTMDAGMLQSSNQQSNNFKVSSRTQAIQLAKQQYQGKVLKAQANQVNGRSGYQVKLISKQGVVFYVFVDAQTGVVSRY